MNRFASNSKNNLINQRDQSNQNLDKSDKYSSQDLAQIKRANFYKSTKYFLQYILSLTLLVASFIELYLVIETMVDCPHDNTQTCSKFLFKMFQSNLNLYLLVGLTFSITWLLGIKRVIFKQAAIITFLVFLGFVLLYDNQITLTHYGGVTTKIIGFIGIVLFIVLILLKFFLYNLKTRSLKTILVLLIIIGISFNPIKYSCKDWNQGLSGHHLIQTREFCKVKEPSYCPYTLFENIINLTPFVIGDCQNKLTETQNYLLYMPNINLEKPVIGFENTHYFLERQRSNAAEIGLLWTHLNSAKSYDSVDQALDNGREIALDIKNMTYHMRVKRNESLIEERLKQKEFQPFSKNILTIFFDAVSRQAFQRALPLTAAWFEKRVKKNLGKTTEFFRYYSLKPYTYPNFMRFYYEIGAQNIKHMNFEFSRYTKFPCEQNDDLQLIPINQLPPNYEILHQNFIDFSKYSAECLEKYAEFDDKTQYYIHQPPQNSFRIKQVNLLDTVTRAGFVVGRTATMCVSNAGDIFNGDYQRFYDQPPDHEGIAFACDPNYRDPIDNYALFQGDYSIVQRCLAGKSIAEHSLDYARKFYQQYRKDSKFMFLQFIQAHQPSSTVIRYVDQHLAKFLEDMEASGLFDDTLIIVYSDHGQHSHFFMPFINSQQFNTERMMPILLVSTPKNFNEKHPDLLKDIQNNNQQLFTSANVHFFLQTWLRGGDYQFKNQSLFNRNYPSNNNCEHAISDLDHTVLDFGYDAVCVCDNHQN